jgi:hypothetical protein
MQPDVKRFATSLPQLSRQQLQLVIGQAMRALHEVDWQMSSIAQIPVHIGPDFVGGTTARVGAALDRSSPLLAQVPLLYSEGAYLRSGTYPVLSFSATVVLLAYELAQEGLAFHVDFENPDALECEELVGKSMQAVDTALRLVLEPLPGKSWYLTHGSWRHAVYFSA